MHEEGRISITSMPKPALQAIYHAITGKTENITQTLTGNVLINLSDFDQLHNVVCDQASIYTKVVSPTVTVVIKDEKSRAITYSSWEKFKLLNLSSGDVTSEVILRFEFLFNMPETDQPQRCIVDINLDSALPVIKGQDEAASIGGAMGFFFSMAREWRTVEISIEFVDYVVAKSFVRTIEEWFSKLKRTPVQKLNSLLLLFLRALRAMLGQSGRLGAASFLAGAWLALGDMPLTSSAILGGGALLLAIWSFVNVVSGYVAGVVLNRVFRNLIPTMILFNEADSQAYASILGRRSAPLGTLARVAGTILLSFGVNLASSYTWFVMMGS